MCDGTHLTAELRRRAVDAVMEGMPQTAVASAYGVDRKTILRWVSKFRQGGDDALLRKAGSGRPRSLEDLTEEELSTIIFAGASAYGFETDLWTVGRVRRVITDQFGIPLSKSTVRRRLHDAGLTYQKPEREYYEIDEATRKKWMRYEVPKIRRAVKKHRGILYFQDESNISLTAFLGKTWAPRGQTPKAKVTGKRAGVAATSAISRSGQLLFRLLEKRIASREVIEFLDQMLRHHPHRHLIVVMDQAPPHTSKKTRAWIDEQTRLHVFYLPKYSPDWNPDEKVWNHLKHQELASHQAKNKDELKQMNYSLFSDKSRESIKKECQKKMNHLKIVQLAKDRRYENILILEDIFTINEDIDDRFKNVLKDPVLKNMWNILYFSNSGNKLSRVSDDVGMITHDNRYHCYAVKKEAYDSIIDVLSSDRYSYELDRVYSSILSKRENFYCISHSLL